MLTRATKLKLTAFALVSVLALAYTGFHYANLGRYFGSRGYYVVRLDLANSGGIYPHPDVTYRGVAGGRVGATRPTHRGNPGGPKNNPSDPPHAARLQT